jgi:hypothetical protein
VIWVAGNNWVLGMGMQRSPSLLNTKILLYACTITKTANLIKDYSCFSCILETVASLSAGTVTIEHFILSFKYFHLSDAYYFSQFNY